MSPHPSPPAPIPGEADGIDRRAFLARCAACAIGMSAIDALPFSTGRIPGAVPFPFGPRSARAEDIFRFDTSPGGEGGIADIRAAHWESIDGGRIVCRLCPRECRVANQERGACGARANDGGVYKTLVYGRLAANHVDPVEKKPFFHIAPGSPAYSIATAGCNFQCRFCQNWEISQFRPEQVESVEAGPERIARAARDAACPFIAYTYSEPVIYYEYVRDVADQGNAAGLKSLMVSNGYIQEKALRELLPRLHAVKIDLKGFTEDFYRDVCDGTLQPVLRTLEILKETGVWFEIVVLVIPTLNDDASQMQAMCGWIARALGPDVPVHFTRFHPAYRLMDIPSTPVATLERIHGYAQDAGLRFAYIGNVPGHPAESTYCPGCGETLVRRVAYTIIEKKIRDGRCPKCAREIPGRWK
jgi:pyruvate formate lyase activating enzyme